MDSRRTPASLSQTLAACVAAPNLLQHTVVLRSFRGRTMTARPAVPPAPRNTLRRSALASTVGAANFSTAFPASGSLLAPTPMTMG